MSNIPPEDARVEVKFITLSAEQPLLEHWIRVHPAGFHSPHPDRKVNNVYFDRFGFDSLEANISGISARAKIRYRWYGASDLPGPGALEIKHKRNQFGWKTRFSVDDLSVTHGDRWVDICRRLAGQIPRQGRLWLDEHPCPALLNRYERRYFTSRNGLVRITIDADVEAFDQRYKPVPNVRFPVALPDMIIVEFKSHRANRPELMKAIQGFPLRAGRHSKYSVAMSAVYQY